MRVENLAQQLKVFVINTSRKGLFRTETLTESNTDRRSATVSQCIAWY